MSSSTPQPPIQPWFWYCPSCQTFIPPNEVTHDETHDYRAGGCEEKVIALQIDKKPICFRHGVPGGVERELAVITQGGNIIGYAWWCGKGEKCEWEWLEDDDEEE